MESLIGNLTSLGKETHMTWRLVHDPTVETQSAPCKTKPYPLILNSYSDKERMLPTEELLLTIR